MELCPCARRLPRHSPLRSMGLVLDWTPRRISFATKVRIPSTNTSKVQLGCWTRTCPCCRSFRIWEVHWIAPTSTWWQETIPATRGRSYPHRLLQRQYRSSSPYSGIVTFGIIIQFSLGRIVGRLCHRGVRHPPALAVPSNPNQLSMPSTSCSLPFA